MSKAKKLAQRVQLHMALRITLTRELFGLRWEAKIFRYSHPHPNLPAIEGEGT